MAATQNAVKHAVPTYPHCTARYTTAAINNKTHRERKNIPSLFSLSSLYLLILTGYIQHNALSPFLLYCLLMRLRRQ